MADLEARQRARRVLPARAERAVAAARVEAQPGDVHEDVAVVRVDRDPLAGAGRAPLRELAGDERGVEQPRGGERVADRARAVVAAVDERAVAAAPDVRELRDRVAAGDDPGDHVRGADGRLGAAAAADGRANRGRRRSATAAVEGLDGLLHLLELGANLGVRRRAGRDLRAGGRLGLAPRRGGRVARLRGLLGAARAGGQREAVLLLGVARQHDAARGRARRRGLGAHLGLRGRSGPVVAVARRRRPASGQREHRGHGRGEAKAGGVHAHTKQSNDANARNL